MANLCNASGDIYVLDYTHKYGEDVSAYRTREGAEAAAYDIACERVNEDIWEDTRAKFATMERDAAMAYFHEVELDIRCGETLEITRCQLQ